LLLLFSGFIPDRLVCDLEEWGGELIPVHRKLTWNDTARDANASLTVPLFQARQPSLLEVLEIGLGLVASAEVDFRGLAHVDGGIGVGFANLVQLRLAGLGDGHGYSAARPQR
jgi:hypothetical protein